MVLEVGANRTVLTQAAVTEYHRRWGSNTDIYLS